VCYTFVLLTALSLGLLVSGPLRAQCVERSDVSETAASWSSCFGGELRERFESLRHPAFGLGESEDNAYFLHRAALSGELRHATDLRAVVEVVSGLAAGSTSPLSATQDDALDILQIYVEPSFSVANGQLAIRSGRQELALGASRLISIRDSPNIRRAFDGVRATWSQDERRSVTAFYVRPVFPKRGAFDDSSSAGQRFWGVYATLPIDTVKDLFIDSYYLSLKRAAAAFATGEALERRHTVGARVFGEREAWDWNLEGAWQWGSFGKSRIRAWTASIDVGFELSVLPLSPRVGLKADAISGDRNPRDRELVLSIRYFPSCRIFRKRILRRPPTFSTSSRTYVSH
jgi:hypothetical protein